jgi:hypothetical protein
MKGKLVVSVAVVLVLGVVGASYYSFFVAPERRSEHARSQPPETLVVAAATGRPEIAGADGVWRPVAPGTKLSAADQIRTDEESTAELRAPDGTLIKLSAGSAIRIAELRRELKRFHLGAGMVEADVRDDPTRVFEVEVDDDGGVARTRGAAFTAVANGRGGAAVASRRGEVTLSARGREVVIRTGQFARLRPGAPPDAPAPVPPSLFLKVDWPAATSRNSRLGVSGRTAPGARIKVGSHFVTVDEEGRYHTEVEVPDGVHQLHVQATDVGGHIVDEKSPRIVVDTKTDFHVDPPKWK